MIRQGGEAHKMLYVLTGETGVGWQYPFLLGFLAVGGSDNRDIIEL